jgi:lipoic acid synthetase
MILGDICTRACKFCGTITGRPLPPDPEEPRRLAESISLLQLRHCVITSVDRDDLSDGGASFWAETIRCIKRKNPGITIETLIPDFDGKVDHIQKIIDEHPDVIFA